MEDLGKWATGAVITLLIGGTAYSFSQADVVRNFAEDTGLSQEQAEQYVNEVNEEDLAPFGEIASDFAKEGQMWLDLAREIDCVNYEYGWESATLPCAEGKAQLNKLSKDAYSLGQAYAKLDSDSASEYDMTEAVKMLDQMNTGYRLGIVTEVFDWPTVNEWIKINSYNKALLKAALESSQ